LKVSLDFACEYLDTLATLQVFAYGFFRPSGTFTASFELHFGTGDPITARVMHVYQNDFASVNFFEVVCM